MNTQQLIENIWDNRDLLKEPSSQQTIREVIELLDKGKLRTAEPTANGWQVNDWVKKAVILYFPIQQMETIEVGPFEFHDKMKLKNKLCRTGRARSTSCSGTLWCIFTKRCDHDAVVCKYRCLRR
jgi:2,3,4,5-tetrahydropyridine-2-carboxylate N-succinyltransferase